MQIQPNGRKVLAIVFLVFIIAGGILTLALSPVEIFGGLVRGYLSAPEGSNVFQKVSSSFKTFDDRVNLYFAGHDLSIHAYGGIQKVLGRSLINDTDKSSEVLKLNNGYLTFKSNADIDLTNLSQYLLELKETCNSVDSELVYVHKISKSTTDEHLLPPYYPYIYSSNFEEIRPLLEQNEIAIVDIEQAVIEANIDKYSLFFKTDHHWTPQTGVWVAGNICNSLNEYYDWDLNTNSLDIEQFSVEIYPQSFLGSEGKRTGALYAGVDDFAIVKPINETSLTVEMQDINLIRTGSFEETLLFPENITPEDLLNNDTTAYMTYMQGNHPLVTITNHMNNNGKTALLVMDSYGCVVAPYLALEFQQLDCIDIRSYTDSVEEYIKQTSPDVVIYAIENYQK